MHLHTARLLSSRFTEWYVFHFWGAILFAWWMSILIIKISYLKKAKLIYFIKLVYTQKTLTFTDIKWSVADCRSDGRTVFSLTFPFADAFPTPNSIDYADATVDASFFPATLSRPTYGRRCATSPMCPRAAHTGYWHFS